MSTAVNMEPPRNVPVKAEELSTLLQGLLSPVATLRTAVLKAVVPFTLPRNNDIMVKLWIGVHDATELNASLAKTVWAGAKFELTAAVLPLFLGALTSPHALIRTAAATALGGAMQVES